MFMSLLLWHLAASAMNVSKGQTSRDWQLLRRCGAQLVDGSRVFRWKNAELVNAVDILISMRCKNRPNKKSICAVDEPLFICWCWLVCAFFWNWPCVLCFHVFLFFIYPLTCEDGIFGQSIQFTDVLYDSLVFWCFCSFIWFLFCSVVFGYGIYRNQRQAPMPLTLQDVKNTSDPRWFLVCKSTFEIVYTLPEYVFEIHVKWWFWCYVRVCVCFVVFVPIFACTKCLPKQSRAFVGINSALNVAMLSGQEQIWAGTSYLGAFRDCLVGSRKSTLPRVAY